MKPLVQRTLLLLSAVALLALSAGCKTAEGLGEDIEDAGESIQDGAS
jgi:predicted small secreted protein